MSVSGGVRAAWRMSAVYGSYIALNNFLVLVFLGWC